MRKILVLALLALVGLPAGGLQGRSTFARVSTGNIYYVAAYGSDANPGSLSQPWQTIYKATRTIAAGDTVYIRAGTYQESNIFYTSGTETAPITISAYPGEDVTIDGNAYQIPSLHSGNALIQVRGDWYIIRDLTFTRSGDQGVATKGAHDTIDNVYSHHNWGWGIWMAGNHDITQNSRVWSNSMMNENKVMATGWAGGVTCARYPDYCTIRNTRSWGNWGEGISTFESLHTTVEGNTSYDNQTSNIYISDTRYAVVQGNLSYCTPGNKSNPDFIQIGLLVYDELGVPIPLGPGGTRYASSDNQFLNNIVAGCDTNLFATQIQAVNNLYAYNTFVNSSLDRRYYAANVKFQSGTASNQRFVNNLVFQSDAITIVQNDSPGIMSFANNLWSRTPPSGAAASGPGDVIGDPQFAMLGSPYSPAWFKLTGSSPAINKGQVIPETNVDFYGVDRNTFPDIGALEYTVPTFSDVPYDYSITYGGIVYSFHDTIQALYDAGYTDGCSTDPLLYCPDNTLTRAESAVFMLRGLMGTSYSPPLDPSGYVFTDDWSGAISWGQKWAEGMWNEGLTAGCSTDPLRFCPATAFTRAEASVFGLRIENGADYVPPAATHIFADDWSGMNWAEKWAEAAYLAGLLPACGESGGKPLFCPGDLVTRAWAAYVVVEAKDLPVGP